ncbi:hypothetical protein ABZ716_14160 [Streptomyces sp. NPDC006687]|uniref:hypothetical protein n=1 Tax=unclassified Streptomyces TaxID=2593676 RepID=UPI0033ED9761
MYTIKGVTATPGGRSAVRFHDQGYGYAVTPDRRAGSLAGALLGEGAGCVTALVLLALTGLYTVLRKTGAPEAALTACVAVFLVALCYGLLIVFVNWAGGVLLDILFLVAAVATLPAMLFPAYRRALRRGLSGGAEAEPAWVPATALAGVWHQPGPGGGSVVTVQHTDGSVIAFVPAPEHARDLYERLDGLLRDARSAPWRPGHGHAPQGRR